MAMMMMMMMTTTKTTKYLFLLTLFPTRLAGAGAGASLTHTLPLSFISSATTLTNINHDGKNDHERRLQQKMYDSNDNYGNDERGVEEKEEEIDKNENVQIQFETKHETKEIFIKKGEILRTALMKRGISPHNGNSRLINCRGLGTCGTCAVEVQAQVQVQQPTARANNSSTVKSAAAAIIPETRSTKENLRLNFPPHDSNNQSRHLRLACQIQICDDVHVKKKSGFWGQSAIENDLADAYDAELYLGDLEYVLDDKSPPSSQRTSTTENKK